LLDTYLYDCMYMYSYIMVLMISITVYIDNNHACIYTYIHTSIHTYIYTLTHLYIYMHLSQREMHCWKCIVGNALLEMHCWKCIAGNALLEMHCWHSMCNIFNTVSVYHQCFLIQRINSYLFIDNNHGCRI
jgi:hypothetical protein